MITEIEEDLKKIALAGVGAAAIAGEKADEIAEEFVRKGEQVVQKGRKLNEELKHHKEEPCTLEEVERCAMQLSREERKELIERLKKMDEESTSES